MENKENGQNYDGKNIELHNTRRNKAELYFIKVDAGEFDNGYYNLFTEDVELYFPKFGFGYGKDGLKN